VLAPVDGPARPPRAPRRRLLVAVAATIAVLAPLAWMWQASLLPDRYSVMDMGSGAHAAHGAGHGAGRGVDTLTEPSAAPADVLVELVARAEPFRLASGELVEGYTLNGTSPGPVVRAEQGQLVQVRLVNESVREGATLHWHGVDVPNAMDGVAGVTQDAVPVGGSHTYRFRAEQAGTFWYHSHQVSHEQVQRGLLGALVITPPGGAGPADEPALVHLYDGLRTVNGRSGESRVDAVPGERVRVRVINSDNGPMSVWVPGAPFRVLAVDGTDLHAPGEVRDVAVEVTGGARADLEVVAPARVELGGSAALLVGAPTVPPSSRPSAELDLLSYGAPAALGFDPAAATRSFDYVIGRRPGFLDGVPGLWWTINGGLFPDVPAYVVTEGDVVTMRVQNRSGEGHPMHLHGHHAVVLARNGVAATGSPWWVDSLQVADGDTYDIAFVADNPGVWMDHCHNLPHAAEGLMTHLTYEGVTTPYRVGGPNEPE
jgi:FtsP/CotA-like multicopper oxidase with cupredoxin domain